LLDQRVETGLAAGLLVRELARGDRGEGERLVPEPRLDALDLRLAGRDLLLERLDPPPPPRRLLLGGGFRGPRGRPLRPCGPRGSGDRRDRDGHPGGLVPSRLRPPPPP